MFQKGVGSVHFTNPLRYPFTDARLLEDVLDIMKGEGRGGESCDSQGEGGSDGSSPRGPKPGSYWDKVRIARGFVNGILDEETSTSSDDEDYRRRAKRKTRSRARTKGGGFMSSDPVDPLEPVTVFRRTGQFFSPSFLVSFLNMGLKPTTGWVLRKK